jgi:hypothetical protein
MKTLSQTFALIACFSIAAAACGGGDEDKGYGSPIGGVAEQQAATNAIDSIYSLRSFQDTGGNDDLALSGVTLGFIDVSSLLSAKFVSEAQQGQGQQYLVNQDEMFEKMRMHAPAIAVAIGVADTASALGDDCISATADTVTYNNCTWLYGRIDGWITVRGDHLSFDLDVVYEDTGFDFSIKMDGSIDVSDTQIVGNFSYDFDANYDGSVVEYNLDGEFDVALSDGCAIGGFLEINGRITASAGGSSGGWDGWVRAEFGPTCGQVRVY